MPALEDRWFDTAQAANYIQYSESRLHQWRAEGAGPTFYRLGSRIRYKQSDLDAWIEKGRTEAVR